VSFTWAADWRGETEPVNRHDGRCPVWQHPGPVLDPEEDCKCRGLDGHTRNFQAGVQEKVDRFESYAGRPS
jgi:hypothetical protein